MEKVCLALISFKADLHFLGYITNHNKSVTAFPHNLIDKYSYTLNMNIHEYSFNEYICINIQYTF